jgi:hypothetical protein
MTDDSPLDTLADDQLDGAAEIALFVYGKADKRAIKRTYHAIAIGVIPARRIGGRLLGSKARIREAYDQQTSRLPVEIAPPPGPAPAHPTPKRKPKAPPRRRRRDQL